MELIFPVFAIAILVCFAGVLAYCLYHFIVTWIDNVNADDRWEQQKAKQQETLIYGKDGEPQPWDFQ